MRRRWHGICCGPFHDRGLRPAINKLKRKGRSKSIIGIPESLCSTKQSAPVVQPFCFDNKQFRIAGHEKNCTSGGDAVDLAAPRGGATWRTAQARRAGKRVNQTRPREFPNLLLQRSAATI